MSSPSYFGGFPLGERDSHFSLNEAIGTGANVQTLSGGACRDKQGRPTVSAPQNPAPLDQALGGLSLNALPAKDNGVPDLSHATASPTTSAESGVLTPPVSALGNRSDVDLLKPTLVNHSEASSTTDLPSSAEHSAAPSEDEGPPPKPRSPVKQASVSSVATVVSASPQLPTTPARPAHSTASPPLSTPGHSPKPHLEKKTSAIGKLFHHKATPTGSANASTASLTARGPPPSKSAGAAGARSPNVQSGDESDGGLSETSQASSAGAGGALRALGRRMSSNNKPAQVPSPNPNGDTAKLDRRPSTKKAAPDDAATSKLERRPSKQEGHMTLKEYVAAHSGGIMSRKPSATSRHSDDGRSEKGSDHGDDATSTTSKKAGSVAGGTTASLLQKYGVCEKAAIGKGATAVVRLAHKWDRSTERLYAVKEFRKRRKNETEREYVKKLTSEFCISSTLHHAHVVETVDLVQDENHHWCEVMEYCPGGDLYAAIKKGNMTQPQINSYFKQMILGVAYLHSMGVAHRDIKPENLLLDARGYVKITDFGVSDVFRMCWEKGTHLSKGLCGSEPYIAPEQFEHKEYDARMVDVWACAIVFYCMVAQELPWRAARGSDESFARFVERYEGSPAPAPIHTLSPKECRGLVKRMLNPDPKARVMIEGVAEDKWLTAVEIIETTPPGHSASAAP